MIERRQFKIDAASIDSYARVMANEIIKIVFFIFITVAAITSIIINDATVLLFSLLGIILLFSFVGLLGYFARVKGARNMGEAAIFTLSSTAISLTYDATKFSESVKLSEKKVKELTGENLDCQIPYTEIKSTTLGKNGFTVLGNSYNLISKPKEKIFIPNGIIAFEKFKATVMNNKSLFKYV